MAIYEFDRVKARAVSNAAKNDRLSSFDGASVGNALGVEGPGSA